MSTALLKNLKIKTDVCHRSISSFYNNSNNNNNNSFTNIRLHKDLILYKEEAETQREVIKKLEDENADEYDIKQQVW
jgi:hypothetical protein